MGSPCSHETVMVTESDHRARPGSYRQCGPGLIYMEDEQVGVGGVWPSHPETRPDGGIAKSRSHSAPALSGACPDCGDTLTLLHHPHSFALPEAWSWGCGCGWRSEPE